MATKICRCSRCFSVVPTVIVFLALTAYHSKYNGVTEGSNWYSVSNLKSVHRNNHPYCFTGAGKYHLQSSCVWMNSLKIKQNTGREQFLWVILGEAGLWGTKKGWFKEHFNYTSQDQKQAVSYTDITKPCLQLLNWKVYQLNLSLDKTDLPSPGTILKREDHAILDIEKIVKNIKTPSYIPLT